jgi:hypothetical protein
VAQNICVHLAQSSRKGKRKPRRVPAITIMTLLDIRTGVAVTSPACPKTFIDANYAHSTMTCAAPIYWRMTKLLDKAFDAARRLDPADQDEFARVLMALVGDEETQVVAMTPAERAAIAFSKSAASKSEFASEDEVRAVWAKHGL